MADNSLSYAKVYKNNDKFDKESTTTEGKLANIIWQISKIANYRRGNPFAGLIFGFPGGGMQCERHVHEYQGYGFQEREIQFLEISDVTHAGQVEWAKLRGGFEGALQLGDGFKAIDEALRNGVQVGAVDLDDTGPIDRAHVNSIRKYGEAGVPVILLTVTCRTWLTDFLAHLKRRLKKRRRWSPTNRRLCNPIAEITIETVRRLARRIGYDFHHNQYIGKGKGKTGTPMVSFVLTKKVG